LVADNYTAYSKEEPKPAAKPLAAKRTPSAEEEEEKKQAGFRIRIRIRIRMDPH
jgi:hypothetical protein